MRKSDLVFFATGVAALVYETVWARLFARLLGSDAAGAAIVLAMFMLGLGAGAWTLGRLAHRARRPVAFFCALEVALGVWAALSPEFLALVAPVEGTWSRALVAAAFLLPPTCAMGATFPLMARIAIADVERTASETSAFYGANTLGAACGALLAAAALMPLFGLSGALRAAAVIDFAAAALAYAWLREVPASVPASAAASSRPASSILREPVLYAAALLGAASLGLEVLALRLLVTVTGASVYAFAVVLTVFLFGIGLGSRQLAQWKRGRVAEIDVLFYCALSAPLLALAGLWTLRFQLAEGDLFGSLSNRVPSGIGLAQLWASHVLLASLALLLPALAFGMALPAAAGALAARHARDAREVWLGRLYAANTLGALIGSLAAAFALLPHFGPRWSMAIVLATSSVGAAVVAFRRLGVWLLGTAAAAVVATQVLAPADERAGLTVRVHAFDAHTTVAVEEQLTSAGELVRTLRVNGKPEASSGAVDQRLQLLLGHVPGLLHGHVERALVIGLGSGMTAGSLLDLPTITSLDVFEISAVMPRAAREFGPWNNEVLDDPRTRVRLADGRHALATSDERFDLITADPVHPWTRGSSDLYTLEHFEQIAAHLAPKGIASQWLPVYELSTHDLQTVAATWCAAFEHTAAYLSAYDLILLGARAPGVVERSLAGSALPERLARSARRIGIDSAEEIAALEAAGDRELRAFARPAQPMRDDRPVLEFRAPLAYLSGYNAEVLAWAARDEYVGSLAEGARAPAREFRAAVRQFLEHAAIDPGAAAGALGQALVGSAPAGSR